MRRIVILGCAGSGKTTLARRLGELTGAPVICLDSLWQRCSKEKDLSVFRSLLMQAHAAERWISDGNFAQATFDIRLPRATLVIWLECSRLLSIWRVINRLLKQGEPHHVRDVLDVLSYIWNFSRVKRPHIDAIRAAHGAGVPVRRLIGRRAATAFLSSCCNDTDPAAST